MATLQRAPAARTGVQNRGDAAPGALGADAARPFGARRPAVCDMVTVGERVWPRPIWPLVWPFDYSGAPTGRERPRQIIERAQQALSEPKRPFDYVIKRQFDERHGWP